MSSLAAAKADNFYFPPNYDPAKHGSLNKFHGQHALRDRARKLESEGILIIRFEVPFNIWCGQCGEHIAKGVRFNAEKKQVGTYFSTKVWSFTMRHHCGCRITITTDPKNAEYLVTAGARRKVEAYDAQDAQTMELPDANERAQVASDPLASLERTTLAAQRAASGRAALAALAAEREAKGRDGYALNKQLRAAMRQHKKADRALDTQRQALGLPEHVRLLPQSQQDGELARAALLQQSDARYAHTLQHKRQRIMTEGIFGGGGNGAPAAAAAAAQGAGGGSGSSSSHARRGAGGGGGAGGAAGSRAVVAAAAAAAAAAPAAGGSRRPATASAKEQLQQRVLLSKRRRQQEQAFG